MRRSHAVWHTGVAAVAALAIVRGAVRLRAEAAPPPHRVMPPAFLDSLHTGDLILRGGTSAASRSVRLLADRATPYSHIGLVVRTRAGLTVVHSLPADEVDPAGGVRREPLASFVNARDAQVVAVYRLVGARAADAPPVAARWATRAAAAHLPFDPEFDLRTPDRLYCTELVLRAYASAGVDLGAARTRRVVLPGVTYTPIFPSALLTGSALRLVVVLPPSRAPEAARP